MGILRGRATATFADQAFSSGSNFLVGVVVARLAGPGAFGAFALAYAVWLLMVGIHRALIVNPMMIVAPESRHATGRLEQALAAEILLSLVGSLVVSLVGALLFLIGSRPLGGALIVLAPWLPVLLMQDLWRWIGFMRAQPAKALANDVVFTVTQVGLLAVLGFGGHLGTGAALAAWGGGAAVGAAVGLRQFGVRIRLTGGWTCLQRSWSDGRWLLADFMTSYGASQGWQYLVTAMLGPAAFGLVRAAYNLMGPIHVLLFGGSNYGLPASVDALHSGGWKQLDMVVRRVTTWLVLGVAAYVLPVAAGHDVLVELVYGTQYREIGSLVVLAALNFACISVAFGAGIGLTAARRTRALFLVRMCSGAVSATCFLVLGRSFGVVGAGWASLIGSVAYAVLMWTSYRWARRSAGAVHPVESCTKHRPSTGGAGPAREVSDTELEVDMARRLVASPVAERDKSAEAIAVPRPVTERLVDEGER